MIVMKERLRSFGLGIRVLECEFEDRWNSGKCGERRRVREGSGIMHTRNAVLQLEMEPAEAVTGYAEKEAALRVLSVGFATLGCCCGAVVLRLCCFTVSVAFMSVSVITEGRVSFK